MKKEQTLTVRSVSRWKICHPEHNEIVYIHGSLRTLRRVHAVAGQNTVALNIIDFCRYLLTAERNRNVHGTGGVYRVIALALELIELNGSGGVYGINDGRNIRFHIRYLNFLLRERYCGELCLFFTLCRTLRRAVSS